MPTYQDYLRRRRKAVAAGDAEAVAAFDRKLRSLEAEAGSEFLPPEPTVEQPNLWESFGAGGADIYQGAKALALDLAGSEQAPDYHRQVQAERGAYARGRGPDAGIDWMRLGGQTAALAPLALIPGGQAGLVGRTAGGIAAGGIGGALPYASQSERVTNAAIGGVAGGALSAAIPPLLRAGTNYIRPRAVDAYRAITGTTGLDDVALDRIARARQQGVELTTGQATRDPKLFATEQNIAKLDEAGAPLAARFQQQREAILGQPAFTQVAPDLENVGESVRRAAVNRDQALQQSVREAYDAVSQARPDTALPKQGFVSRMADIYEDFDPELVPAGIRKRIEDLISGERLFTAKELQRLDQYIERNRPRGPMVNRATDAVLSRVKRAALGVLDEAAETQTDMAPLYRQAREKASSRFRQIENKFVSNLLRDTVSDEKVFQRNVIGSDRKSFDRMMSFIEGDPEAADQIRAAVLGHLQKKSLNVAEDGFKHAAWNKELERIGRKKLDRLFGAEQAQKLYDIGQIMKDIQAVPTGAPINFSNTAPTLLNYALQGMPGGNLLSGVAAAGQSAARDRAASQFSRYALAGQMPVMPVGPLPANVGAAGGAVPPFIADLEQPQR